ncbi:FAD-dependent pyridine nucleotide-disulfide oxidoreductase [Mesorhizobium sp. ORS 3359]|nr:FAD-dependent pyridine nucleotide-disulfide oxidoreductase [Mesorhizobium sp. ORS 3359]
MFEEITHLAESKFGTRRGRACSATMTDLDISRNCDVAVVGGGPAGLAAAIYLSRFLRSVSVFDVDDGRAKLIPRTNNCPGFPEGISGNDLLIRLREQAVAYGTEVVPTGVESLSATNSAFVLETAAGNVQASRVVLATGVVDRAPAISGLRKAIASGAVRLCPVCDAYEVQGQRIAIVGPDHSALREALYLRRYSPSVSIICNYPEDISAAIRREAQVAGIAVWDGVDDLVLREAGLDVVMADGSKTERIGVLYAAMGCDVRSELAMDVGAHCDEEGYILIGPHAQTSADGVYAIGDVAKALNQIAVGFGQAALAATHIHNSLMAEQARGGNS